jgi:hypothetical protein
MSFAGLVRTFAISGAAVFAEPAVTEIEEVGCFLHEDRCWVSGVRFGRQEH